MVAPEDCAAWLYSHRGLSGRSPDPAVRAANAKLLMPFDDQRQAMADLHHYMSGGKEKVVSTCALFSMAYQRECLGLEHPLLVRPYAGHNDCTVIVPAVAIKYDLWMSKGDERLCELPGVGDIVRIDNDLGNNTHFDNVAGYRAEDGVLLMLSGGQGDNSLIEQTERMMVIDDRGRPWLVNPQRPRDALGNPNGRLITGRMARP